MSWNATHNFVKKETYAVSEVCWINYATCTIYYKFFIKTYLIHNHYSALSCSVCKKIVFFYHFFFCPKDGLELCWLVPETCKRCFQMFSEKSYIYMRKLKWGHVVRIQRCGCGVCKDFGWCYDIPNRKRGSHLNRYQIGKKNWNSFGHKLWT